MTTAVGFRPLRSRLLIAAAALALVAGLWPTVPARAVTPVFINEIHYDNTGTDAGEAVEIAGPAGTDLTGWSIVLYNGSGGAVYDTDALSGVIPSQQVGFGTVVLNYPVNGIQNGAPDGVALVNGTTVVQFLSYEGSFVAVGGPANGLTSTDIGVLENGSEPVGQSLQLTGSGTAYEDFTWASPMASTFGAVNTGQVFASAVALPVATCGAAMTVGQGFEATRTVTGTDSDGTVTSLGIVGITPSDPGTIAIGTTTPASGVGGTAAAVVSVGSTTPVGSYSVQVRATNDDTIPQSGDCTLSVTVIAFTVLPIGTVQGSVSNAQDGATHRSPFAPPSGNGAGSTDVFVQGVVTQKFLSRTSSGGNSYGIFLQNSAATADADPNTSDGIFVFMSGFPDILRLSGGAYVPMVGDEIVLRARVTEFFFLTELSSPRLVGVVQTGVPLPAALEADPPDVLADANRFWERGEGMRYHLDADGHVIAARDVFPSTADGEVWVIRGDHPIANRADPYERLVYRDPHPLDDVGGVGSFDNGNGMRILLTSHGLKALAGDNTVLIDPARTYDTITNELTGSLYFAFSKYSIEVEQQPVLVSGVDPALNFPPQAADPDAEFATSDYNVENLYDRRDDPFDGCDFTGNAGCPGVSPPFDYVPASQAIYDAHLADLAAQIAGPMHGPDILMIQEAEDQDICTVTAGEMDCGVTDNRDGKPDTLQELALAILDAGGPMYDTAYDRDGADDRGIVSAFMFRIDTVELLPADADDPVLGDSPTVDYRGTALTYNTDVSNPKALNADLPADVNLETGFDGTNVYTRPPQVGHFRVWRDGIGESVFTDLYALSNHFSSTPDARVGQRIEQSLYNVAIIEALADAGADRVISGGDFNVFPRPDDPFAPGQEYGCSVPPCDVGPSDQLGPVYDAGLNNLWDVLVVDVPRSAYSYNFVGQVQTLDMQFATDGQFDDLVEVRAGHFNADFAADYDGDFARGASDHDPQLARWSTDVTIERLHALVDYYVASGDLSPTKASLLHARLNRAASFLAHGQTDAYLSQLEAFGDQAQDLAPVHLDPDAADALEKEADRLMSL